MNDIVKKEQTQVIPLKENQASTLMSIIEKIATNPKLDDSALSRIERLYGMHKELLATQARQEYGESMARAQGAIQIVSRNKMNDHTKSQFADIAAVHAEAKPCWTKEGFSVSSYKYDAEKDGYIGICCEVRHSGGHQETYRDVWPLDIAGSGGKVNKTAIQAMGSTMQYARRYTEMMIFDVSTSDDNDGQALEFIDIETAAWIKGELQTLRINVKAFCGYLKCKDVDSMSEKQLPAAKTFIKEKRAERGNS